MEGIKLTSKYVMSPECAEIELQNRKKERCRTLYLALKNDFSDLESENFREHWFNRARHLKELGCWFHYNILVRKARDYVNHKGDYPDYLNLVRQVKKSTESSSCLSFSSFAGDTDEETEK